MEAAAKQRELTGEKAQRIIEVMRRSVAERGTAGSTFEHVAREAGVSRGLLHYYFGTKERLLVEVVRRDSELRIDRLDDAVRPAKTVDDVLDALISSLEALIENDPGWFVLVFELFSAGRRNPEIQREIGDLYERSRSHAADILQRKHEEGAIELQQDARSVVSFLFAVADGFSIQRLSTDGERDTGTITAGRAAARSLLTSE